MTIERDMVGMRVIAWCACGLLLAHGIGCFGGSSDTDGQGQPPGAGQSASGTGAGGAVGGTGAGGTLPVGTGGVTAVAGVGGGGAGGVSAGIGGAAGGAGGAGGMSAGAGGNAGAAGTMGADPSCSVDADCMLCVGAISSSLPCCPGCPAVMAKAECAAVAAAMMQCAGNPMQPCPVASCLAPGTPKCADGACTSVGGFADPDCAQCTRTLDPQTCGTERPVHWECGGGFPSMAVIDACTDRATGLPRYCCPADFGTYCGDF